jgi:hypothetical protein
VLTQAALHLKNRVCIVPGYYYGALVNEVRAALANGRALQPSDAQPKWHGAACKALKIVECASRELAVDSDAAGSAWLRLGPGNSDTTDHIYDALIARSTADLKCDRPTFAAYKKGLSALHGDETKRTLLLDALNKDTTITQQQRDSLTIAAFGTKRGRHLRVMSPWTAV